MSLDAEMGTPPQVAPEQTFRHLSDEKDWHMGGRLIQERYGHAVHAGKRPRGRRAVSARGNTA